MLRIYTAFLIFLAGIALPFPASAKIDIFACEPEWAALAREVGGDKITAFAATSERQDPHHIRARPSLIAKIRRADLLICSGAGLEIGWLPILLQRGASGRLQPGQPGYLMTSSYVAVLEKPAVLDRSLGDIHPEGNPHVHLDARNMIPVARELVRRLGAIDPANMAAYGRQGDAFIRDWSRSLADWAQRAAGLKGMPVIVHHKAWTYLIHWLGLKEVTTLEQRPGIPPTVAYLDEVLHIARSRPVKAILRTPYDPPDASEWLSAKTDIPALVLPFTVSRKAGRGALHSLFDRAITLLEQANAGR